MLKIVMLLLIYFFSFAIFADELRLPKINLSALSDIQDEALILYGPYSFGSGFIVDPRANRDDCSAANDGQNEKRILITALHVADSRPSRVNDILKWAALKKISLSSPLIHVKRWTQTDDDPIHDNIAPIANSSSNYSVDLFRENIKSHAKLKNTFFLEDFESWPTSDIALRVVDPARYKNMHAFPIANRLPLRGQKVISRGYQLGGLPRELSCTYIGPETNTYAEINFKMLESTLKSQAQNGGGRISLPMDTLTGELPRNHEAITLYNSTLHKVTCEYELVGLPLSPDTDGSIMGGISGGPLTVELGQEELVWGLNSRASKATICRNGTCKFDLFVASLLQTNIGCNGELLSRDQ